jgi:hypothetical protein
MMSILCSPNGGFPLIGLVVGGFAALIWMMVHGRFRETPDNPIPRFSIKWEWRQLIIYFWAGVGFVIGLVLSQFISFKC